MWKIIFIGIAISIIIAFVIYIRKAIKESKEFQKKIAIPGTKLIIKFDCTVTEIKPTYITYNDGYGDEDELVNPFFKKELTNKGIAFKHLTVKDLGYTWVDKENKKGFNSYEIEYWNWD